MSGRSRSRAPFPFRFWRPGLGVVDRPTPAVVLDRNYPRLLRAQAFDMGLRRLHTAERQRRHGAVRPDPPDRPLRRAGPAVAGSRLAQLDLVVRRGLRDVPNGVLVSTGTRSPSSLTSTTRSVPGVRAT